MVSVMSLKSPLFAFRDTDWMNSGPAVLYNIPYSGLPDCLLMIKQFGQEPYRGDILSFLPRHIRGFITSVCHSNTDAMFDCLFKVMTPDLSILKVPFTCEVTPRD